MKAAIYDAYLEVACANTPAGTTARLEKALALVHKMTIAGRNVVGIHHCNSEEGPSEIFHFGHDAACTAGKASTRRCEDMRKMFSHGVYRYFGIWLVLEGDGEKQTGVYHVELGRSQLTICGFEIPWTEKRITAGEAMEKS